MDIMGMLAFLALTVAQIAAFFAVRRLYASGPDDLGSGFSNLDRPGNRLFSRMRGDPIGEARPTPAERRRMDVDDGGLFRPVTVPQTGRRFLSRIFA